ncbi:hypothetical protein [Limnohabitans sp. 2KL-1]|uniref:hypothetical protein n=1 Tax=Limnohabitans sp. 2KL-1 TaxID=1100699 RepID=UPI001E2FDE91|nr:hypothetical protein [Limnohabitans sp. 2KL-1]
MKPAFHAALGVANGIDWANRQLAFVGILVVFPGIANTQQVQVQATDQGIENALRPAPAKPRRNQNFLNRRKSR